MNRLLNTSRFILLNTFLQKKYTPVVQTQLYSLSLSLSHTRTIPYLASTNEIKSITSLWHSLFLINS